MVKDFYSQFLGTPKKIKSSKIRTSTRGILPRKRDIQRTINPQTRIREPINADLRKKVLKRAKNKCEWKGCNRRNGEVKLKFHHIDGKRDHNTLKNIMALCSYHHDLIHVRKKRIVEKDLIGMETSSRVVSSAKARQIKKERKNRMPWESY